MAAASIDEQDLPPEELAAGEIPVEKKSLAERILGSTPWYAIAILVHVIILAGASVFYLASHGPTEQVQETAVNIRTAPPVLPPAIETPPEPIDRNSVPVLPDQEEGPVNPDPDFIPDAAPGRQGEITDETDPTKDPGIYNPDPEALSNLPSGATGGTPIGVGAVGHHGTGVPSAFASRRAGGGGKGGGGLGQGGGGGRGGGSPKTDISVLSGLLWLRNHQSPNGNWDADGYDAQCTKGTCTGKGGSLNDVGLTGLALLCFLGHGDTHVSGPFQKTVKEGLKYLMTVQDPDDGCFGSKSGQHYQYNHACAALAMAEAYGMTQTKAFQGPAQKGLDFVMKSRNPYKAWRYGIADGDNDSSVTGWMVMALKSGKMAGLGVEDAALRDAASYIDELTDPTTGRTGYKTTGTPPARQTELMEKFPSDRSESLTAVGMLVRIFSGRQASDDPLIGKGADLLAATTPKWNEASGDIDMYYWYYGTLSMFQVGGTRWDKWNEAMKTAIIDHQHMDKATCLFGSWDPMDPWSQEGGRVYSTTLNTLCMLVYYRYPRVFGMGENRKDAKAPGGGK